ncbi:FAD-dependent oxidoreductase [Streptomyces sp. A3M-1-3]|uniref:FAD-dependent oxidoreductase n=1 Tax=Streptomyces sp. A3M-1-3 TaxID=2962044 RepID=UPI0020B795F1|nr:FAD-dependent oxidoreductase [Streptomyces sp. A3M-1-3]MCP3819987.1 FAD-dependent oxidoreductase [Streptomyces sp. A3M-1-3]
MTTLPGVYESHWMETAQAPPRAPLSEDIEVDVAVVGAGIAGLSTAWELSRTGRSVAVLEAGRVAAGVSGYTTAKVCALHTLIYDRLRRTRGPEGARLYARSQSEAVEHVANVADEVGIDCELERAPAFTYCEDPAGTDGLRAEAEAAAEAGLNASYVTETGLPFAVAGAVRLENQAQFHPRKYLLALAEDLQGRGGLIYERTRVTHLKEGEPCRIRTAAGMTVTARSVVSATHYPLFDRAMLFTRLSPHRELVVAGAIEAHHDPGGLYITEEQNKRSVRTAPYGEGRRLLIVTGESFTPGTGDTAERFARLAAWAQDRFSGVEITRRWAAQDNDPTDTVPLVGRMHPGGDHAYVATGFGGWGMSGGVMAGRLLAALIEGEAPPWAGLYDPRRLMSALREAPGFLKHQAAVGKHFVGDRLRTPTPVSAADIAPGTGAVVRVAGERCAVYRDEAGTAHAVTARCTHLGCIVAFNNAELTWECPCHGSRFTLDGDVVQGPANRPLDKRDVEDSREGPGLTAEEPG